jgi:hypothetical protein
MSTLTATIRPSHTRASACAAASVPSSAHTSRRPGAPRVLQARSLPRAPSTRKGRSASSAGVRCDAAAERGAGGGDDVVVTVEVRTTNGGVRGAADTVRAYYDAVNRRDVTTALSVVADDVLYEDLALYPKVRAYEERLRAVGATCSAQR